MNGVLPPWATSAITWSRLSSNWKKGGSIIQSEVDGTDSYGMSTMARSSTSNDIVRVTRVNRLGNATVRAYMEKWFLSGLIYFRLTVLSSYSWCYPQTELLQYEMFVTAVFLSSAGVHSFDAFVQRKLMASWRHKYPPHSFFGNICHDALGHCLYTFDLSK